MNDWIKQFDKEFGIIGQITSNLDLDDYHQYLHQDIKSFIQELLDKQREELREWVYTQSIGLDRTEAFNVFLDDLLTKLEKK